MTIKEGDRVIATENITPFIFTKIRQGTKGKVTHVNFFGTRFTVEFDNGETEECGERQVAPIKEKSSWW